MENLQFERLKIQVNAASAGQLLELEDAVQCVAAQLFTEMVLARRTRQTVQVRICPHCNGNKIALHGKDQNQRQRFRCRGCGRTYNIMTGTPMARARKPGTWLRYLGFMTSHMSVRKIVSSGIGVHHVTVWRWRHRFLKVTVKDNASILSGVVEASETFFARSFKGSRRRTTGTASERSAVRSRDAGGATSDAPYRQVAVLTALDNGGGILDAILTPLTDIEAVLEGRIASGSVLCSDGKADYANVADRASVAHCIVSVTDTTQKSASTNLITASGRLGLGRVTAHHQRLKHLVNERCRGVATKYLANYLGWHRAMTRPRFEGRMLLVRALALPI